MEMTNDHPHQQLTRRERQMMNIIYGLGEATAAQVRSELPDPPTHTGVRTMLRLLELKGHLTHRKQGRRFVYLPTYDRQPAGASALRSVLKTFFDGSIEKAMATHLADEGRDLSDDELRRLATMIRKARQKGEA